MTNIIDRAGEAGLQVSCVPLTKHYPTEAEKSMCCDSCGTLSGTSGSGGAFPRAGWHATLRMLLVLAMGWTAPLAHGAILYDAVNDFTVASNPNGVWSYGTNSGTGGSFSAFTNSDSDPNSFAWWLNQPFSSAYPNYYPLVAKNITGSTFTNGLGLAVPTDVLYMAPGINLQSIVQFTAAESGQHTFTGGFLGLQQPFNRGGGFGNAPGPTALVSVLLNGVSQLTAPLNAPSGSPGGDVPISLILNLTAGDTVQFRVDSTQFFENQYQRPDLDIQGDSIGLRLSVLAPGDEGPGGESPVPEPSTLGLMSLALGALLARKRFLRR